MATKIASCPFCNSHRIHVAHHLLSYSVTCETCKCNGPHKRLLVDAITEWNLAAHKLLHARVMEEPLLQSHLLNLEHAVRNLTGALRYHEVEERSEKAHYHA